MPLHQVSWLCLVDDSAHSFENPKKQNHSVTVPIYRILLGSDSLKFQHKTRTHRSGQKLPPLVKEYIFFQMDGGNAHDSQCSKSCSLTKVIDLILDIESFEQKCVIGRGRYTVLWNYKITHSVNAPSAHFFRIWFTAMSTQ